MRFPRSSGILLPIFSLPRGSHIGDLGPGAYEFVDFLRDAGQSIWQLLPLGPPAAGNSPYSSYSAFAGNPLLISCDQLVDDGLLTEQQLEDAGYTQTNSGRVDYQQAGRLKDSLLAEAFATFQAGSFPELEYEFEAFCIRNRDWLDDFVLFEAIAKGTDSSNWTTWGDGLVKREPAAIEAASAQLTDAIAYSKFQQFVFSLQWRRLKAYANENNVRMYGDMPIFVAFESADVWCNQSLFQLGDDGRPNVVAGVPPDYFSETGQMWGNPLYRWDRLAETQFEWWVKRLKQAFELFDLLRIDHFRGFESYWEVPGDAENAISGRWVPAPGDDLFARIRDELGNVPIIAEDLGLITDEVHALRDRLQLPGMRVMQFGYDHAHDPYHRPESYPDHSVAYTGTHDNDTVRGWYDARCRDGNNNELLQPFLSNGSDNLHIDMMKGLFHSAADTVIVPVQDLLGLDSGARMNTPGEPNGNWDWRCLSEMLTADVASQVRELTDQSNRLP
ncbi:MAG: 4-alpha-glucanotransferase [Planctomycetaceae bacterium]